MGYYYTFDYGAPRHCKLKSIKELKRTSPLHYVTPDGIVLHPFFDAHHERYVIYWER